MGQKGNVIDLDKYRVMYNLREKGFRWLEDSDGKVRVWMRTKENKGNNNITEFLRKQ